MVATMKKCKLPEMRFLFISLFLPMIMTGCFPVPTLPSPTIFVPSQTQNISIETSPWISDLTPTPTFLPTVLPNQIQQRILSLIKTNGGCKLPCFWGIKPGVTKVQDVMRILEPLTTNIYYNENGIAADFTIFPEGVTNYSFFSLSFHASVMTIQQFKQSGMDNVEQYFIPNFLETYGQPEEVWIQAFKPIPGESTDTFDLIAFYGKKGIAAFWQGTGAVQGKLIHGCIDSSPGLYLWSPDPYIVTITDTSKLFDPILPGGARALAEASEINIETFYKKFKEIDNPVCLDTPLDLWCEVYSCGYPPTATP
jgi:hypothetical protein